MLPYPHIDSIWKRVGGVIIEGDYSTPEFAYLADNLWVGTEKIDGTNVRVIWRDGQVRFGGRTDSAQMPTFLLARLQELFPAEKMAAVFSGDACLYGEGFGARIQKDGGNYIPNGVDFALFDVRVTNFWLRREDVESIASVLGIAVAPVVFQGRLDEACALVREGMASHWGTAQSEGLILQPETQLFNRMGHRIITKLKTRDYLRA